MLPIGLAPLAQYSVVFLFYGQLGNIAILVEGFLGSPAYSESCVENDSRQKKDRCKCLPFPVSKKPAPAVEGIDHSHWKNQIKSVGGWPFD